MAKPNHRRAAAAIYLLFAVALGAGGVAIHLDHTAVAARAVIAQRRAILRREIDGGQWRARARTTSNIKASQRRQARAAAIRAGATNPEFIAAELASVRADLPLLYGLFYAEQKLTPAQIASFEDIKARHERGRLELRAAALIQGLDPSDEDLASLQRQNDDELQSAQLALLGSDGLRQLKEFERTLPLLIMVCESAAAADGAAPAPPTTDQLGRLIAVMRSASAGWQKGGDAHPTDVNWSVALPEAKTILSPAQLAGLKFGIGELELSNLRREFYAKHATGADR